ARGEAVFELRRRGAVPAGHRARARAARRVLHGDGGDARDQARPAQRGSAFRGLRGEPPRRLLLRDRRRGPARRARRGRARAAAPGARGRGRRPTHGVRASGSPRAVPLLAAVRVLQTRRGHRGGDPAAADGLRLSAPARTPRTGTLTFSRWRHRLAGTTLSYLMHSPTPCEQYILDADAVII